MQGYHHSVLLKEVIEFLEVKPGNWYLDGTLGDGGHTLRILELGGKVLGLDVDPQAIGRTRNRLQGAGYSGQDFKLIQGNFRDIKNITTQTPIESGQTDTENQRFAGAIFDLGVSSLQLDSPEKGFSFMKLGPLDMRLDPNLGVKALDLVNALPRKELYELFKNLGEEKHSRRLADALVRAREIGYRGQGIGFSNTKELADFIVSLVGWKKGEIHPATRVFQALRIAVNDELGALKEGLEEMKDLIKKNGVVAVISFHSLEDRIVKNMFKEFKTDNLGENLTKKPIIPSEIEIQNNARSRSAKLRAFKFI